MNQQSKLEIIRSMESEIIRAVSQTFGELEGELMGDFKPYGRPTVSSQTSRLPNIRELIGKYTTSELLELSERLDKLEAQHGKA